MHKANLAERESFITADGSAIRELAHPAWTAARNQSLAEATVDPGAETAEHAHPRSEELYYFVAGEGRMRLDDDEAPVADQSFEVADRDAPVAESGDCAARARQREPRRPPPPPQAP